MAISGVRFQKVFLKNEDYQHIVQVGGPGPKDHPASGHKIVHTYKTLTKMFAEAGFTISLLEYQIAVLFLLKTSGSADSILYSEAFFEGEKGQEEK